MVAGEAVAGSGNGAVAGFGTEFAIDDFGKRTVAGFGTGDAANFGAGGEKAGSLVSESTGGCPRTVDPEIMSQTTVQRHRELARRSPRIPSIIGISR